MSRTLKIIALLCVACCSLRALALPDDQQKSINITADSSQFNYKLGTNVYEGNVKVTQGSTMLTADRVVTTNVNHHIQEVMASGNKKPAKYTTTPKMGEKLFIAQAKIIKFYPAKSLVILQDDVIVSQGENTFHGPLMTYNMKDQIVTAPASKSGRATLIIQPSQL